MANAQFFDPSQELEAKRKRVMAQALLKQAQQGQGNEMAGGFVLPKSGIERLNNAAQGAYGQYQADSADELDANANKQRAALYAQALGSQDPRQAAALLAQDPQSLGVSAKLYGDALTGERQAARDAQALQLQQMEWQRSDQEKLSDRAWDREKLGLDHQNRMAEAAAKGSGGFTVGPDGQVTYESGGPRKLSATEQKEFYESKDITDSVTNALGMLDQVDKIREQPMYSGFGSQTAAMLNRVPGVGNAFDDTKSSNTTTYNNLLRELAYSRLKATFPGQISNAERESIEKLQALSDYTPTEQKQIIDQARTVLSRQQGVAKDRQQGILTGNIYDPQSANNGLSVGTVKKGYRFKGGNPQDQASWEKVQ